MALDSAGKDCSVLLVPCGSPTFKLFSQDGPWVWSDKAVRELGAAFRPLADTLRDEVEWYRQRPLKE
jgi:hypothetical protein